MQTILARRFKKYSTALITSGFMLLPCVALSATYNLGPSNYRDQLDSVQLEGGDIVVLEPGSYERGLYFNNVNGIEGNPIVITGPESGEPAVFLGRNCCNTVQLENASYLTIRHIKLDGQGNDGDGVNSRGYTHNITIENLLIVNHGGSYTANTSDQQIIGISTKGPAWDWVIRNNVIIGAGTGMYLGDSSGNLQFARGIIEHNLVLDTLGYSMEIKHQNIRPTDIGMPTEDSKTIIRHNVFSKINNSSFGGLARPNLLVGHLPSSGAGSNDLYEIYGNFIYQNASEALFQGEGNIALYDNVFVNPKGSAVHIQPHNGIPRNIKVFHNTIVSTGNGIKVTGVDSSATQLVMANAVFAQTPINVDNNVSVQHNITDTYANSVNYLQNPNGDISDSLIIYPLADVLKGAVVDTSEFLDHTDWNKDFNGTFRDGTYRGAYAGDGVNPGWQLQLDTKPVPFTGGDSTEPTTPLNVTASSLNVDTIALSWTAAQDTESRVVSYRVYRNDELVATIKQTSYEDSGLQESTRYTYAIAAVNGAGMEGAKSDAVNATTKADTTSPALVSVDASGDATRLTVLYDEAVGTSSAETATNYRISPSVAVLAAQLDADNKTVVLNTGVLSEGVDYRLIVNNVQDQSIAANNIEPDSEASFTYTADLVIDNTQPGRYQWDVLTTGKTLYLDRDYTYTTIPAGHAGLDYLRTANDDKNVTVDNFIQFNVNRAVTVYIGYDERNASRPTWLEDWTDTGEALLSTDQGVGLRLYSKDFAAGNVTLGGNSQSGNSMYVVIVKAQNETPNDGNPNDGNQNGDTGGDTVVDPGAGNDAGDNGGEPADDDAGEALPPGVGSVNVFALIFLLLIRVTYLKKNNI